jgi:hypothetical protein
MKWWIWVATAAVVGIGVILLAGKKDMIRMRQMREM